MKLYELTPSHLRCQWGACPALFQRKDTENFIIIGKKLDQKTCAELTSKIPADEFAIEIKAEFFDELFTRRKN